MSLLSVSYQPIGIIHTNFKSQQDAPIQGALLPDSEGEIELYEDFADGLKDLDGFERITLITALTESRGYRLETTPYLDDNTRGLFATRSPRRPNAIGLTTVRLLSIDGNRLLIAGVDMVDGTPLLDIKPYVPHIDAFPDSANGWIGERMAQHDATQAHKKTSKSAEREAKADRESKQQKCAQCGKKECYSGKDCLELRPEMRAAMLRPAVQEIMQCAAGIESQGYGKLTRLEELIHYCHRMNIQKIGLAFCVGLQREAREVDRVLRKHVEVVSACCKLGGIDKRELGLPLLHAEREHDISCNPVGQARVFNDCGTQLNVILGLCLGHDILFTTHSKAPVTTLVVKDRVLGHNPVMALWSSYHRNRIDALEFEKK